MLGDLSGVAKIFLVTGYTDMRRSIDGLASVVKDTYELDPYSNSLFLFCGRRSDRIKALHFDKTGFVLMYYRLDSGRFQWPRTPDEARSLTRQEYRREEKSKKGLYSVITRFLERKQKIVKRVGCHPEWQSDSFQFPACPAEPERWARL